MPSRFSAAFRRKSTLSPDDFENQQPSPTEHSSFRVLERSPPSVGRAFDGGAHMSNPVHRPTTSDTYIGDNLFVGLNSYR